MSADGDEKFGGDDNVREQDKYLPIANISRIMKRALPHNAKISKDAKEAVQECVSEYISFITSEASDKCQREKRKTINGEDLLWAMTTLGFQDSIETLRAYLHKHRECEGEKAVKTGGQDVSAEGTSSSMAMQLTMVPSMQQGGMVPVMPANYTMAYAPMAAGMQMPAQIQQQVVGNVNPEAPPAQGSSESQV